MNPYRKKPLHFPWPPLFYLGAIALGWTFNRILPLPLGEDQNLTMMALGVALILIGVALDFWALSTLLRNHTTAMPNRTSKRLVTCGPFRLSRNPTYLGYTIATFGIGVASGNGWIVAASLISAMITYAVAIRREEQHLMARFGIEFERYRRSTRTWI
jgi:protein-S-isoprenylcysteine O-methyltransferase Ste14